MRVCSKLHKSLKVLNRKYKVILLFPYKIGQQGGSACKADNQDSIPELHMVTERTNSGKTIVSPNFAFTHSEIIALGFTWLPLSGLKKCLDTSQTQRHCLPMADVLSRKWSSMLHA